MGSVIVDWLLETVAISDPLASRPDTLGGAMQSNDGEVLVGADVSKAWIDICQSETVTGRSHR